MLDNTCYFIFMPHYSSNIVCSRVYNHHNDESIFISRDLVSDNKIIHNINNTSKDSFIHSILYSPNYDDLQDVHNGYYQLHNIHMHNFTYQLTLENNTHIYITDTIMNICNLHNCGFNRIYPE